MEKRLSQLAIALTIIGLLVSLIKAYYPFYITSQSAMTLIFILSVIRVVQQP